MKKAIFTLLILCVLCSPLTTYGYDPRYLFTDQEKDTESGLYNFDAREYNPEIGRFIQPDPVLNNLPNPQALKEQTGQDLEEILSNPQNLNYYSYTRNNPVKYVDPNGEFVFTFAGIAFGGVFGMSYSYRNVYSYFKNVIHGDIYAASNDAEAFLDSTRNGAIVGATIGMALDTVWGMVGLAKLSSPLLQINNNARTVTVSETSNIRFTQSNFKTNFSSEPGVPKFFQNRSIDEVARAIRLNNALANQLPVDYIDKDGYKLIVNTRSAITLQKAGIDVSKWNWRQITDTAKIQDIENRLNRNQLPAHGTTEIKY